MNFLHISLKVSFYFILYEFLVIFRIWWVLISLTERNNCSFPARLHEFFMNSGSKGLVNLVYWFGFDFGMY